MIDFIIAAAVAVYCFFRTFSFGVWCLRKKNTAGGISLFILSTAVILSLFLMKSF